MGVEAPDIFGLGVEDVERLTAARGGEGTMSRESERPVRFESLSGIPVEPLYTPESLGGLVVRRQARPARASTRSRAAC